MRIPHNFCGRVSIVPAIVLAVVFFASVVSVVTADDQTSTRPAAAQSVFLIGNSLTWDTVPSKLAGDVQWHVDCGKSLPFIHANPEKPCVKTSTLWPLALKQKQYDIVSMQTHYGATLRQDADTISKWVSLQSQAVFVIHTGWARSASREEEHSSKAIDGPMQHSDAYVDALLAELRRRHPGRVFRSTHAMRLLELVGSDIREGKAPLKDVSELYRDKIHMKLDTGRYLMHNAMRAALGQPRSAAGFQKLEPSMQRYLDSVLDRLPKTAR